MKYVIVLLAICLLSAAKPASFDEKMQSLLDDHFKKYQELEYFSGGSLSIYIPGKPLQNYFAGKVSHDPASKSVTKDTLFQIGSITKSFTGALVLVLEKENKLHLNDTLSTYLPEYPKWGSLTIDSLLNMTSCLPNYSDAPLFNVEVAKTPEKYLSPKALLEYVYPSGATNPPLRTGYFYSNTGYQLVDMIVEKTTKQTFNEALSTRLITPLALKNTFYPVPELSNEQKARMAHGYQYNSYDNPLLVGKDVTNMNLGWAGAAGGIIATTEDIILWVKELFTGSLLDDAQKKKLTSLHSTVSGKAIERVSRADPQGFGLGVVCKLLTENEEMDFWFYEGKTMGFRALYIYVPSTGILIASAFNSSPDDANDHAHELIMQAYQLANSLRN